MWMVCLTIEYTSLSCLGGNQGLKTVLLGWPPRTRGGIRGGWRAKWNLDLRRLWKLNQQEAANSNEGCDTW